MMKKKKHLKDKRPFMVDANFNEIMGCYEVIATIGGIKTMEEVEITAKILVDFIVDEDGWYDRPQAKH
jgi:hypothetical protein